MKRTKRNGMTLIELIISIAVLSIILIGFLSMFSSAILGIYRAGDKGQAYTAAQEDLDTRIASGESIETDNLELVFGSDTYSIPGGLVDTDQYVRSSQSEIESFIPLVPTISVEPKGSYEGASTPITIDVTGTDTNFTTDTEAELLDKFGNLVESMTPSVSDATTATVSITSDLLNEEGKYILRIITPVDEDYTEAVRANFNVYYPELLVVSTDDLFVSGDGTDWINRSDITGFPSYTTLSTAIYGSTRYLVGGTNGRTLVGRENMSWTGSSVLNPDTFSDITWSVFHRKFFGVTSEGRVYSSPDGSTWSTHHQTEGAVALNGVHSDDQGNIIAVGDGGLMLKSSNSYDWTKYDFGVTGNFNAIHMFNNTTLEFYVLLGDNGLLLSSIDGLTWTSPTLPAGLVEDLKAVAFRYIDDTTNHLIAVGESGTILHSSDQGASWAEAYNTDATDFNDVTFRSGSNKVYVVGEDKLISSSDFSTWILEATFTGEELIAITGK